MVVVDAGGSGALHMATPGTHEGSAWRHALYQAATTCGPALEQQQLTQDNVPVILDKCINFIYAHGKHTWNVVAYATSERRLSFRFLIAFQLCSLFPLSNIIVYYLLILLLLSLIIYINRSCMQNNSFYETKDI